MATPARPPAHALMASPRRLSETQVAEWSSRLSRKGRHRYRSWKRCRCSRGSADVIWRSTRTSTGYAGAMVVTSSTAAGGELACWRPDSSSKTTSSGTAKGRDAWRVSDRGGSCGDGACERGRTSRVTCSPRATTDSTVARGDDFIDADLGQTSISAGVGLTLSSSQRPLVVVDLELNTFTVGTRTDPIFGIEGVSAFGAIDITNIGDEGPNLLGGSVGDDRAEGRRRRRPPRRPRRHRSSRRRRRGRSVPKRRDRPGLRKLILRPAFILFLSVTTPWRWPHRRRRPALRRARSRRSSEPLA